LIYMLASTDGFSIHWEQGVLVWSFWTADITIQSRRAV